MISPLAYIQDVYKRQVQRVPATETQGRVHTSAASVAVLPEACLLYTSCRNCGHTIIRRQQSYDNDYHHRGGGGGGPFIGGFGGGSFGGGGGFSGGSFGGGMGGGGGAGSRF